MDNDFPPSPPGFDSLAGGGEVGERMRALNWTNTPLGPVVGWPQSSNYVTLNVSGLLGMLSACEAP